MIQKVLSLLVEKKKTKAEKQLQEKILESYLKAVGKVPRMSSNVNYTLVQGKIVATKRRKIDAD